MRGKICTVMTLAVLLSGCVVKTALTDWPLAVGGRPEITIVVPDNDFMTNSRADKIDELKIEEALLPEDRRHGHLTVGYFAREMARWIEKGSGIRIPVVRESQMPEHGRIVLFGPTETGKKLGYEYAGLRPEEIRIRTWERGLAVYGEIYPAKKRNGLHPWFANFMEVFDAIPDDEMVDRGTRLAAREFLLRLGFRFFLKGENPAETELFTNIPQLAKIALPANLDFSDAPAFQVRTGNFPIGMPNTGVSYDVTGNHTDTWWGKKYGKTNPGWFALGADGKRQIREKNAPVKYSNPEVLEHRIKLLKDFYSREKRGHWPTVDRKNGPYKIMFYPVDGKWWDYDPQSLAYVRTGWPNFGEPGDYGSHSNLVFNHTIELAKRVKELWPEKRVLTPAYNNYMYPPDAEYVFPDNVDIVVCLCRGVGMMTQPAYWDENVRLVREWSSRLGGDRRRMSIWNYSCWPQGFTPGAYYFPKTLKRWLQTIRPIALGEFINAAGDTRRNHLMEALWRDLLWNPDLDWDDWLDAYCRDMYGPAAAPMKKFFRLLTERYENTVWREVLDVSYVRAEWMYGAIYPPAVVAELKALYAAALAAAPAGSKYRGRLEHFYPSENWGDKKMEAVDDNWIENFGSSRVPSGWLGFFRSADNYHKYDVPQTIRAVEREIKIDGDLSDFGDCQIKPFILGSHIYNLDESENAPTLRVAAAKDGLVFGIESPGTAAGDFAEVVIFDPDGRIVNREFDLAKYNRAVDAWTDSHYNSAMSGYALLLKGFRLDSQGRAYTFSADGETAAAKLGATKVSGNNRCYEILVPWSVFGKSRPDRIKFNVRIRREYEIEKLNKNVRPTRIEKVKIVKSWAAFVPRFNAAMWLNEDTMDWPRRGATLEIPGGRPTGSDARPVTVEEFMRAVPKLDRPLEPQDYPVFIWGGPVRGSMPLNMYIDELYARGLAVPANIMSRREAAIHSLKYYNTTARKAGVIAQGFGQVTSQKAPMQGESRFSQRKREHKKFEIGDLGEETPTGSEFYNLGAWKEFIGIERARTNAYAEWLKSSGAKVDVMINDWELWARYKHETAPDHKGLEKEWQGAKNDPLTQKNVPAEYLASPAAYLKGIEMARGAILREAIVAPFKKAFPGIVAGNYFSVPHIRQNDPLPATIDRGVGWWKSNLDFGMPVHYGWIMSLMNEEHCGWNMFHRYVGQNARYMRNLEAGQFLMPWVERLEGAFMGDKTGKDALEDRTVPFRNTRRAPWPRAAYREYLYHSMLRGVRTFCIFKPNTGQPEWRHEAWLDEVSTVLGVYREVMLHRELMRNGQPMNLDDLPGDVNKPAPAVWSGMTDGKKALIRLTSFSGKTEKIPVRVFGKEKILAAPPEGKTHVFNAE